MLLAGRGLANLIILSRLAQIRVQQETGWRPRFDEVLGNIYIECVDQARVIYLKGESSGP